MTLQHPLSDHRSSPLSRPDHDLGAPESDLGPHTGFMAPRPLSRLPQEWELWENALDEACANKLQLADKVGLSSNEAAISERWRDRVRQLPILPTDNLKRSEVLLSRAHHVLAWIMHFYIHTLPVHLSEIHTPPPITVPLLQVSAQLLLPPVLTYSDDVINNWDFITPPASATSPRPPALDNLRCQTLFTGTRDEEEFYLASARIEFRGVEALALMRAMMDEAFLGDATAIRRITAHLHTLAGVVRELTTLLADVRRGCDPDVFYNMIRPWFRGADSDGKRKWVFDGVARDPALREPTELLGPSAGQSPLIHALDIFLGVDHYTHANFTEDKPGPIAPTAATSGMATTTVMPGAAPSKPSMSFLDRMQSEYMPQSHRAFLRRLSSNPRPLPVLVETSGNKALLVAYEAAVSALVAFRDEHVNIVALYILQPSLDGREATGNAQEAKGTGGTDALKFVKGVRNQTKRALEHFKSKL